MINSPVLRIGTRQSSLAMAQSTWVANQLESQSECRVELVKITTSGDEHAAPTASPVATGIFTREIQRALLDRRVDIAVHSLKDLPTETVAGLELAAVPPRAAVADILVTRDGLTLNQLPDEATIGTSSLRRGAQLLHLRPDLQVREIRGNIDTRLRKLDQGDYDAIVLAQAGLDRQGITDHLHVSFTPDDMLPAPAQGALGLEVRQGDASTRSFVDRLNDSQTQQAVTAERAMLSALHGGCRAPVAAFSFLTPRGDLELTGAVISLDGRHKLVARSVGDTQRPSELGLSVAAQLVEQGAHELIAAARDVGDSSAE